jgi:hypothetical protein
VRVRRLILAATVPLGLFVGSAVLIPGTAEAAQSAPCSAAARACLQLSTNQAWLMDNGNVTYGPVAVTTGRRGYETPPGTFKVQFKDRNHHSKEFHNAPMPFSVFFYRGMAFHQGSLKVKSHGCVHLSRDAAQQFFTTLQVGNVVEVVR